MDLDEALAKIARQFGDKPITKEERDRMWTERGILCICGKIGKYCGCDCSCKACWGNKFNAGMDRQ